MGRTRFLRIGAAFRSCIILHEYIYTFAVVINIPLSISLISDNGSIDSADVAGKSVKGDISEAYLVALRAAWVAFLALRIKVLSQSGSAKDINPIGKS